MRFDEEKIKPTATTVDGAQSQQRLGKQAKAIMDEFVKALDKIGETASAEQIGASPIAHSAHRGIEPMRRGSFAASISGDVGLEREQTTREAKQAKAGKSFRERMLKNAPKKDSSHIIAERKSW